MRRSGFLLALAHPARAGTPAVPATIARAIAGGDGRPRRCSSLCMEALQSYLPCARALQRRLRAERAGRARAAPRWRARWSVPGAIDRWSRFRVRWFVDEARGALVLLALWPFALLFPAAVPLGLGQVLERLEAALADWLLDTPFLEWLPVRDVELQPLVPGTELLCVALGALIPCLLAYSVMRSLAAARRLRGGAWWRWASA